MAVILLNMSACGGTAGKKWKSIESDLSSILSEFRTIPADRHAKETLAEALTCGETFFIAAGGDGTVNYLLNALADIVNGSLKHLTIGAIGLGSSNDFHKPFRNTEMRLNIPMKITRETAMLRTIGSVSWQEKNSLFRRYWINNASIGVTAEANHLFNHPGGVLQLIKKQNTDAAILFTAIKTILGYRNHQIRLREDDGAEKNVSMTNLGVVLNPHFSGSFHYDTPQLLQTDHVFVHTMEDHSTLSTLRMLIRLSRGKFRGLPQTNSCTVSKLDIRAHNDFAVEYDGETIRTNNAVFTVHQKAINICSL